MADARRTEPPHSPPRRGRQAAPWLSTERQDYTEALALLSRLHEISDAARSRAEEQWRSVTIEMAETEAQERHRYERLSRDLAAIRERLEGLAGPTAAATPSSTDPSVQHRRQSDSDVASAVRRLEAWTDETGVRLASFERSLARAAAARPSAAASDLEPVAVVLSAAGSRLRVVVAVLGVVMGLLSVILILR